MSKWPNVSLDRKRVLFAFNEELAKNREAAQDLFALLEALPPGQVKNLMKDSTCSRILAKYGIGKEESL